VSERLRLLLRRASHRLAWALAVIVGVATLAFLLTQVLPGDPARMMLGPQAPPAEVARVRALYGLDRPVIVQYARFWGRLVHVAPRAASKSDHDSCAALAGRLHLDLGQSFYYRKPVLTLLATRIPSSLELALAAVMAQLLLGGGLGILAAVKRGTAWDEAAIGAALVGVSAPSFLIGLVLQYGFAHRLDWLPYDGRGATPGEHLRALVLPALTLGIFGSALYARLLREELGGLLAQDFVRTARAKGAAPARVLVVHALRNALVPVVTIAALELGALVGGAVVTEKLFRWPGVGALAVDALLNRDAPVVFGTVLFAAAAMVLTTLLLDLVYVVLDPRLRR
jgi:peptide/nickel transport system permease protein